MKHPIHHILSEIAMWLSVGVAITSAIIYTNRLLPLWFFLVPMLVSVSRRVNE